MNDRSDAPYDFEDLWKLLAGEEWHQYAACSKSPSPQRFFPERGGTRMIASTKEICQTCPAQMDCLEHAVALPEENGVWGGTTVVQRRAIRRTMALHTLAGQQEYLTPDGRHLTPAGMEIAIEHLATTEAEEELETGEAA